MVSQVGAIAPSPNSTKVSAVAVRHRLAMPGTVRYVHSGTGSSSGPGRTPDAPYASVNQGIDASGRDDLLFVLPGHTEDITLATEFVPDVDGLQIIGLGRGARRPTITFDETTGKILISGAGCVLENFLFTISGTKDVVAGISVSAADVQLNDLEGREATATDQFVDFIILTSGADRCEVNRLKFTGVVAGDATQTALLIDAALDGVRIIEPWVVGEFATACIEMTAATVRMFMYHLWLQQEGAADAVLTVHADTTGILDGARLANVTGDDAGFLAAMTVTNKLHIFDLQITNTQGMFASVEAVAGTKGWASGPAQVT